MVRLRLSTAFVVGKHEQVIPDIFMGSLRGAKPLSHHLPLSFEGEGDTGGEVDKRFI